MSDPMLGTSLAEGVRRAELLVTDEEGVEMVTEEAVAVEGVGC